MKNKLIAICSIFAFAFGISSCADPFVFTSPWGQISQDEDGNIQGGYTPRPAVVQGAK